MVQNLNRGYLLLLSLSLFIPEVQATEFRPMETDRPSKTEETQTVEPHRVQIETELFSTQLNRVEGRRERLSTLGEFNLRFGLTTNSEIGLILPSYLDLKKKEDSSEEHQRGMGDMILRYRYNLQGNQGEAFSLSALPFIKIPTGSAGLSNGRAEFGMIAPLKFKLTPTQTLKSALQIRRDFDNGSESWHHLFQGTLCYITTLTGDLQGFVEVASARYEDQDRFASTFDFGLFLLLHSGIQLDYASYIGLTEMAEDQRHYVGISFKL
jgi:hypothetical protein